MKTRVKVPFPEKSPERRGRWNREIWARLIQDGAIAASDYRRHGSLPAGVCQHQTALVRRQLRRPTKWIETRHDAGSWRAFHVTIVRADWMVAGGALQPGRLVEVRNWTARRLRNLAPHCRYAAVGVVDVSFNDGRRVGEPQQYSLHAHVIVALKVDGEFDASALLKHIFNAGPKSRVLAAGVRTPVVVDEIKFGEISRVRGYLGRALFPMGNHMRVSLYERGQRQTRDRKLNEPQLLELLRTLKDLPAERRIILSGFSWVENRICRRKQKAELKPNARFARRSTARFEVGSITDDDYYGKG